MAIEKFRPEIVEQMANEKDHFIKKDAAYLEGIINAAAKIISSISTRIRKTKTEYFMTDNAAGYEYGILLDKVTTSHGEDRLYVTRNLELVEILNYGTNESTKCKIKFNDAMSIYDVDKSAFAIVDVLKVKKTPRNRPMPDGTIELESVTGEVHNISPKDIYEITPQANNTCNVFINCGGSKKGFDINCSAETVRRLASFEGFNSKD